MAGSAIRRQERELGMTGNDILTPLYFSCTAPPAIHRRPYYPPPLGHSSHTGSYEADPAWVQVLFMDVIRT